MQRFRRVLLIALAAFLLLYFLLPSAGPRIEPGSVLIVDLSGSYFNDLPNIKAASLALCNAIQLQVPDSQHYTLVILFTA